MNKTIIKRYKKEFEWWLNGGSILVAIDGWTVKHSSYTWNYCCKHIINDKYVEFRKALAKGKTIEMKHVESGCWNECHKDNLFKPQWEYRIKSDENLNECQYCVYYVPKRQDCKMFLNDCYDEIQEKYTYDEGYIPSTDRATISEWITIPPEFGCKHFKRIKSVLTIDALQTSDKGNS